MSTRCLLTPKSGHIAAIPPASSGFLRWKCAGKLTTSLLNWKKRETKVKQEQRAVVIDSLLNEANKQGDRTNVEGTTVKKVAPVK